MLKYLVLLVLVLTSSASGAALSRGSISAFYGGVFVEACGRTLIVYEIQSAHILEEIRRIYMPLPIRRLAIMNNRFLFAFCRLGRIERVLMWDLYA